MTLWSIDPGQWFSPTVWCANWVQVCFGCSGWMVFSERDAGPRDGPFGTYKTQTAKRDQMGIQNILLATWSTWVITWTPRNECAGWKGLDFRILLNCRLVMIILDALVIESCMRHEAFTAICQSCQSLKNMFVVEDSLECLGMRRQTMKLRQTPFCILPRWVAAS